MNLTTFADYFRHDTAEIVVLDETNIRVGDCWDFFYAFFQLGDDLYSCNGKLPVLPYYRLGSAEFLNDQIFCNRYNLVDNGFELKDRKALGRGADPRVVSNGEKAYAISILGQQGARSTATLHDLVKGSSIPIRVSSPGFAYGKNWQPFLSGDELFVVHELTPFRVLRVDVATGVAEVAREVDVSFKLPCFHTPYPMFRGGANAVLLDGNLVGVGRATSQRYRHHPFLWSFEDDRLQVLLNDFFYPFYQCGYNIIDPTSIFFDGDDLLFGLCCTERDWAHTQLVSNMLIRLRRHRSPARTRPLADFLRARAITEHGGQPNLERHMFFCIEMPSAIQSHHELGGRVSTGSAGHLVHGPYLVLKEDQRYCAELSYLTRSCPTPVAGNFEVTVSQVDGDGTQKDFRPLARVDLPPTHGNMGEARVEFDTTGLRGMLLELRVYVQADVVMNAYHIRTWRDGGSFSPIDPVP